MSTGLLASGQVYKRNPDVSRLVVALEAKFVKKAVDIISFTCADGKMIEEAIERSGVTGESTTVRTQSTGRNKNGEIVSEFWITWSFKTKSLNASKDK